MYTLTFILGIAAVIGFGIGLWLNTPSGQRWKNG